MKFCLSPSPLCMLILACALQYQCTEGYSTFIQKRSPFPQNDGGTLIKYQKRMARRSQSQSQMRSTLVMYEPSFDPPSNDQTQQKLKSSFMNALENTENWITKTLASASSENPHARNEVSYVCELNQRTLASVAGIFRRYKEARQLGERHEKMQRRSLSEDSLYEITPLKRTQVMIIPFCKYFLDFKSFEQVIQGINKARRNSKNLVTDYKIEQLQKKDSGLSIDQEWSVNVNAASLHPEYATSPVLLDEMEKKGEIDDNERQRIERKNLARQSPYPTLILEVQAAPEEQGVQESALAKLESVSDLNDAVNKLESIFAMSAALHTSSGKDDIFYDAIGRIIGIEELKPNPIGNVQGWVIQHDPMYNPNLASWTTSELQRADSAFEFVFTNLSMHKYMTPAETGNNSSSSKDKKKKYKPSMRSYLILPRFVSSSATSFEQFADDVRGIINVIDGLNDRVSISVMHPEHVDIEKQSPSPVIIIQWYEEK